MSPGGQVVHFPHDSVGAPGDGVRHTDADPQPATGAHVGFRGADSRQGLHVPGTITFALDAPHSCESPGEIRFIVTCTRTATARAIGTWHPSTVCQR